MTLTRFSTKGVCLDEVKEKGNYIELDPNKWRNAVKNGCIFLFIGIFIIIKFVNMNRIIERVVSQTINKFINENCSKPSIIKENDGDDMGIYKELDDKVYDICYRHGFNVQTRVGNDLAYYAFFIADDRLPKVQEAIQMLEKLGLRRINNGTLSGTIHYYTIDFH